MTPYETIIAEIGKLQREPDLPRNEDGSPAFPSIIPAGEDGGILTNPAIEKAIRTVATSLLDARPGERATHTTDDWHTRVWLSSLSL